MTEILTQKIELNHTDISLFIRREDLIHPIVSGNKIRKLKYNLIQAKSEKKHQLLTFGGAFSNHIVATAFAGKENGFSTVGIIRGNELAEKISDNPTLKFAQDCGMQLKFISRENYRNKNKENFLIQLKEEFGDFYFIPEGGTNELAVKGCEEILTNEDSEYDFVCCSVGTGGTIRGIINSSFQHQKILGFPAIKGDFFSDEIRNFVKKDNWKMITDYHFGGYGKVNSELISFINQFYLDFTIPLDPIYTGKMVFGILDLIKKGYFPENSKILLIHTGGLQGIVGMNKKLNAKQLQTIQINV